MELEISHSDVSHVAFSVVGNVEQFCLGGNKVYKPFPVPVTPRLEILYDSEFLAAIHLHTIGFI